MNSSLIDNEKLIFWNKLIEKSENALPLKFAPPSKPQAIYASAGKTGLKWVYAVKENESWVELEILCPGDKIISHQIFDQLHKQKIDIERQFGEPIHWDKEPKRKTCRIQTKPRENFGVKDSDNWKQLQGILIDKMKDLLEVFKPYIQGL